MNRVKVVGKKRELEATLGSVGFKENRSITLSSTENIHISKGRLKTHLFSLAFK